MKINGTDIRVYNAKQLTVDVQPPSIMNNYEWLSGATLPTELETDVQMGHLKLSIYFKGKDRNSIIRSASEFMMNFTKPCRLELDGYKGTYIGFIASNDYEKKNVKQRYVVNVEFDGFFVDDDLSITFDGKTSASFYKVGTRDTPCVVEVYAKSTLTNYTITGLGEDIIVEIGSDRGCYFMEGLNLRKISLKSDTYDFYTRIYPIGKDLSLIHI